MDSYEHEREYEYEMGPPPASGAPNVPARIQKGLRRVIYIKVFNV